MRRRPSSAWPWQPLAAGLGVLASLACSPGREAPRADRRPDVVLVLWDTVRADRLSLYGYERPTTPALEAFAREATVYERAISPANWTLPAHAGLFTGLATREHGATDRSKHLPGRFDTLAERLRAAGYDTWAFTANPFVELRNGVLQGFETVERAWEEPWAGACEAAAEARLIPEDRSTLFSPGAPRFGPRPPVYKDCATRVDDALLRWLDARPHPERPYFAYLGYMEAHVPRLPSREAREQLLPPDAVAAGLAVDQRPIRQFRHMFGLEPYDEAELRALSDVYDAALLELDRGTAELFDALRRRGRLADTVVVVTADHGEHLGEHGQLDHKYSLYDPLVRVPLVVRYPPAYAGGRVRQPVSTRDVAATILDLVGAGAPGLPGRPLPAADGDGARGPVFSELRVPVERALDRALGPHPEVDRSPWLRSLAAVTAGDRKLIAGSDGRIELYDLARDPEERRDRSRREPRRAAGLRQALEGWQAARRPPPRAQQAAPPLDAAARAQLRALGYLDGPDDDAPAAEPPVRERTRGPGAAPPSPE